jgi:hypothetical protein
MSLLNIKDKLCIKKLKSVLTCHACNLKSRESLVSSKK